MATTGEKFMRLTGAQHLTIARHAKDRFFGYSAWPICDETAQALFRASRYTGYEELHALGYRPAYHRRKQRGIGSWYFRISLPNLELIAVLTMSREGELVWVTTYAPCAQTLRLRTMEVA